MQSRALDVSGILGGSRLVVLGGTGFLGKIFWSMLLDRYPEVERIYLVVRAKGGLSAEERFWKEIAPAETFAPLRAAHGGGYQDFLRRKIAPVAGDMGLPLCGIDPDLVRRLRGTVHAVVNVAGVVDFNPPLDEALAANAFGAQNLVVLARELGGAPVFHTSTCYVAGTRPGPIQEEHPCAVPFPRAHELGAEAWDPDREIAECLDLVAQAKHRCDDAFRQSDFALRARKSCSARGEPAAGEAYDRELARVRRKFVSDRLVEAGLDRATHWGWSNIYTYTKAIGEQVIARSGLPFAIGRPACCESTVAFPHPAYNEGVNTSAPLIYLIMKGAPQILGKHVPLDFIPADYVVAGMILAVAELLEGAAKPVYQFAAADVNPCTVQRFGELVGLYKRRYYRQGGSGHVLLDALQARYEPVFVDRARFEALGPPAFARAARRMASFARGTGRALAPAAEALDRAARVATKVAELQQLFSPFTTTHLGPFDCSNTRAAHARLGAADRAKLSWAPESIDWADWMMNFHMPAMERRIIPEMDKRFRKAPRPISPHATIVSLVDEMAERHDRAPALQQLTDEGLTRTSFADVKRRSERVAGRLAAAGVERGDRVVVAGRNGPDWPIAYFGVLRAGAVAVAVDPALEAAGWAGVLADTRPTAVVWDETVSAREEIAGAHPTLVALRLEDVTSDMESAEEAISGARRATASDVRADDPATIVYTRGATGRPKAVVLTHANFTSLVAALAPVFPLSRGDVAVSVLPLHRAFELTCGLLLPLSRGARVVYPAEPTGDGFAEALRVARPAAVVGTPEVWQRLEERILKAVDARGPVARAAFDVAAEANRWLGGRVGVDLGRLLFGRVHAALGGRVKWLVTGGGPLGPRTERTFAAVGLRLTEGYGLTEAAPLLTVTQPGPQRAAGVGRPIAGVELRIVETDGRGVGEIVARGPNVAASYAEAGQMRSARDGEGWLHTGDRGRIDHRGRLEIVGRVDDAAESGAPGSREAPVGGALASATESLLTGASVVPPSIQRFGRSLFDVVQEAFFAEVSKPRVYGRAHIPHNRPVLVVANRLGRADAGLVRHALGRYGDGLVPAVLPSDASDAEHGDAMRRATEIAEQGKTLLLWTEPPAGAAEPDPIGQLSLAYGLDVLPVHLAGAPPSSAPRAPWRPVLLDAVVRIGPPLVASELRARADALDPAGAARHVGSLARAAVQALADGKVFDLRSVGRRAAGRAEPEAVAEHPLIRLFGELEAKFRAGQVHRSVSYYVTLGSDDLAKWTVRIDPSGCDVRPGKPHGGQADCVLKTTPEIFARIVRESYVPSPADFLSGAVKSNDVSLLMTFQRAFRLDRPA